MIDAAGFITAGGRSSRMGRDKAWLRISGRPMIEHVVAALAPVTAGVAIIANSPDYARLGLPVFADVNAGIGPLEAVRTGLANAQTSRIVLAGCDLPFVTPDLFKFLLSIPGDHQAIVPVGADGKLEPLCAIYCTKALAEVSRLIARGERKISLLFDSIPTRFVAFEELRHLDRSELFFENINTPQDYVQAVSTAEKSSLR
jgi:molybdopterin-guanine dinucleotide biosynthesis protein A